MQLFSLASSCHVFITVILLTDICIFTLLSWINDDIFEAVGKAKIPLVPLGKVLLETHVGDIVEFLFANYKSGKCTTLLSHPDPFTARTLLILEKLNLEKAIFKLFLAGFDHFIKFRRYHISYALQELRLLSGKYWHRVLSKGINDSLVALRYILKLSHVRITLQLTKALHVVLVQGICSFLRHLDILGIEFLMRAISLG
jgi:hypothetical protein